jgi:hypothetical protein
MPRVPDNPDPNYSANRTEDKIDPDIAKKLFATPPLPLDEVFNDPEVQARVGKLIDLAMNKTPRLLRRR